MSTPEPASNIPNPSTSHQNVEGDRNQAIGQMVGGIVINQLTIHDRVPTTAAPPLVTALPPLTQQEYRQRQVLLNKVKEYWVKGVLERSLHSTTLIELGLIEHPDAVQRPFHEVEEFPQVPNRSLPEGTYATDVFNQMASGRTLLILGEPGSGKTIMLLKLAQDLIIRAEKDFNQLIPVVFNLSSWSRKPQPIAGWLTQEIVEKYQVSKFLGRSWVESQQLILLLDGLDEVKAEQRNACVQALNQFIQTHGLTELAVCCRIQDYQALSERLTLRSAISIQPLTVGQIEQYLNQAGEQLSALRIVLQQDRELCEWATSPLILSVMSLAYQNCTVDALPKPGTTAERYQQLFDAYVERMFQRRGTKLLYSKSTILHWLHWLAQRMTQENQTVFLIELIQPHWIGSKLRQTIYHLLSGLIIGGMTALLFTPILNSLIEFFMKLLGRQPLGGNFTVGLSLIMIIVGLSTGLLWGGGFAAFGERIDNASGKAAVGVVGGIIFGLINIIRMQGVNNIDNLISLLGNSGLIAVSIWLWLSFFFAVRIQPVESLKWSWMNAKSKLINGALWGLLLGFLFGILVGIIDYARFNFAFRVFSSLGSVQPKSISTIAWIRQFSTPVILALINGLGFSLIFELIGALVWGLIGGLSGATIETRTVPNQGMRQSKKNALILALLGAVCLSIACVLIGLPLIAGISLGILLGISGAGIACVEHGILRLLLYWSGFAPWNYTRFLNYASNCILLQKVGGGYIFIHRLLLEYFASLSSV